MARSYIALDTHCSSTDMAVVNVTGKLILAQQAPDGYANCYARSPERRIRPMATAMTISMSV
jgi:hypothetical protein